MREEIVSAREREREREREERGSIREIAATYQRERERERVKERKKRREYCVFSSEHRSHLRACTRVR